ncbi:hypothetical protein SPHINGOT1_130243 [Sphingomonas sp. T1]|nr:hypothetical protein SPHINGOT1_130243 [Sphingomonas sp. T1]
MPLDDCTASSRTRCSMLVTSSSAPSAVCAIEMPSFALRMPWFMPRTCAVIEVEMARPAASSLAELIRLPVDRRSIAVDSMFDALVEALAARSAETFVAITLMIKLHFAGYPAAPVAKDRAVRMGNGRPAPGFREKIPPLAHRRGALPYTRARTRPEIVCRDAARFNRAFTLEAAFPNRHRGTSCARSFHPLPSRRANMRSSRPCVRRASGSDRSTRHSRARTTCSSSPRASPSPTPRAPS